MKAYMFCLTLIIPVILSAQEKKSVEAYFITTSIAIDGILDEEPYMHAMPAKDFVQLQPYNGRPAYQSAEVRFLYDQTAIYVGAMLYDTAPDSIYNFFSQRDNIGSSDYFGVYFDPFNQGQLAFGFFVTPAGVQTDVKAIKSNNDNEDGSWDAVWQCKTRVTDQGWVVEMKIPYSALRFPEDGGGTWGLNMFRNIKRYNSNNSWNLIDRQVSGFIHQEGELTGIKNIKPPVRLSLTPYAAAYAEMNSGDPSPDFTYKGGLDLKYGISESFTLDMMLVPDFGQIQSDDKQLNLSPYELYYSEKRQFFTEGTELFDRGDIFYSRRIGSSPRFSSAAYNDLDDNEVVTYNPTETQLLNATKVSGRTQKGWGLGLLNAMTLPSYATIKDTITDDEYRVLVQPFTNYNVAVVDKSLKNNSYISLINTNMLMAGNPFSANVTATDFQIRNSKKTYAVSGKAGISTREDDGNKTGFFAETEIEKNSGKWQYGITQEIISDEFNPNDLGYIRRNNELSTELYLSLNIVEPFSIFKESFSSLFFEHNRMYNPNTLSGNELGIECYFRFKNDYGVESYFIMLGPGYDYYEPRVSGRYFTMPYGMRWGMWVTSDAKKPLRVNAMAEFASHPDYDTRAHMFYLYLNYRLGRRLLFEYETQIENEINDRGFVDMTADFDSIFFARRDVKTLENVLETTCSINTNTSISLRMRHYWSGALNREYYQLQDDGTLVTDLNYNSNQDENYNAFNIDLVFRWIFAPGSELSLAWKNAIYSSGNSVISDYWKNLQQTWRSDQTNSLSVRILYYIDYNEIRSRKRR